MIGGIICERSGDKENNICDVRCYSERFLRKSKHGKEVKKLSETTKKDGEGVCLTNHTTQSILMCSCPGT